MRKPTPFEAAGLVVFSPVLIPVLLLTAIVRLLKAACSYLDEVAA